VRPAAGLRQPAVSHHSLSRLTGRSRGGRPGGRDRAVRHHRRPHLHLREGRGRRRPGGGCGRARPGRRGRGAPQGRRRCCCCRCARGRSRPRCCSCRPGRGWHRPPTGPGQGGARHAVHEGTETEKLKRFPVKPLPFASALASTLPLSTLLSTPLPRARPTPPAAASPAASSPPCKARASRSGPTTSCPTRPRGRG